MNRGGEKVRPKSFAIGVEGGGSKTEISLFKISSRGLTEIAKARGEGCNATIEGFEKRSQLLMRDIQALCRSQKVEAVELSAVGLGMAGAGRSSMMNTWKSWSKANFREASLWVGSDFELALPDPVRDRHQMVLIAGTGAIAAMRDTNGVVHRVGGWGPLLGDEGSGYWIGIESLKWVCRSLDRDEEMTALGKALQEVLRIDDWFEAPAILKAKSRAEIAALAELTLRHAISGDTDAKAIIRQAVVHLIGLLLPLETLVTQPRVLTLRLAGSLLTKSEFFRGQFKENLPMSEPWQHADFELFGHATEIAAQKAVAVGSV